MDKQCYHYNVHKWLKGDPGQPLPADERKKGRNSHWHHMDAYDIFSMPDKWEYPWFAAWDLSFHVISLVDPDFAKKTGWTALVAKLIHQYGKYGIQQLPPRLIEQEKIGQV